MLTIENNLIVFAPTEGNGQNHAHVYRPDPDAIG